MNKKMLGYLAISFILFITLFTLKNRYYLPSTIEIESNVQRPVNIFIKWDSGSGYNQFERSISSSQLTLTRGQPVTVSLPQYLIKGIAIYLDENIISVQGAHDNQFEYKWNIEVGKLSGILQLHNAGDAWNGRMWIDERPQKNWVKLTDIKFGKANGKIEFDIPELALSHYSGIEKDGQITGNFTSGGTGNSWRGWRVKQSANNLTNGFTLKSVKINSSNGVVSLPVDPHKEITQIEFNDIDINTDKFHPLLFSIQIILSLLLTWIMYEGLSLPRTLGQKDWRSTANFIFFAEGRQVFWIMYLFSFLTFLFWLLGQWPGGMSNDSFVIWNETKTLNLTDWHPYLNALFFLFLSQFSNTPASIVLFQILVTSGLGSYIFYYTYRKGVSIYFILPFFIAFALSPVIGLLNLMLWKDIPFCILILFWGFFIFHLYQRKTHEPEFDIGIKSIAILSFLFIAVVMFRQNGIIILAVLPLTIWLAKLMPKKLFFKFCALSAVFYILFAFVIPKTFNITNSLKNVGPVFVTQPFFSALMKSKHGYCGNKAEDKKILESFAPGDALEKWNYTNWGYDSFIQTISKEERNDILKLFFKRVPFNMPQYMSDRAYFFFWALGALDTPGYMNAIQSDSVVFATHPARGIPKILNIFNIWKEPKSERLNYLQTWILSYVESSTSMAKHCQVHVVTWNASLGLLLLLVGFSLSRWYPATALMSAFILAQVAFLAVVMLPVNFRYVYFIYLFTFFILPLMRAEYKSKG